MQFDHSVLLIHGSLRFFRGRLEEPKVRDSADFQALCALVLCLVADPAERRGRHRTPYKLPLR